MATTSMQIPLRIRVIAYLVTLSLGAIGTIAAAIVLWLFAEHRIDKATDAMLSDVVTAFLGLVAVLAAALALSHLTLPDSGDETATPVEPMSDGPAPVPVKVVADTKQFVADLKAAHAATLAGLKTNIDAAKQQVSEAHTADTASAPVADDTQHRLDSPVNAAPGAAPAPKKATPRRTPAKKTTTPKPPTAK